MAQPVPTYTNEDLERIVTRDFGNERHTEIGNILDKYGTEKSNRDPLRVRMACLKLANGNIDELKKYVEIACQDYRDVLAWAEYSAYMRATNAEQRKEAVEDDWRELQAWLHRP